MSGTVKLLMELAVNATLAIKELGNEGFVVIVVPYHWKAPKGFPRRELMRVNSEKQAVCSVNAKRLLAWIEKETT